MDRPAALHSLPHSPEGRCGEGLRGEVPATQATGGRQREGKCTALAVLETYDAGVQIHGEARRVRAELHDTGLE